MIWLLLVPLLLGVLLIVLTALSALGIFIIAAVAFAMLARVFWPKYKAWQAKQTTKWQARKRA